MIPLVFFYFVLYTANVDTLQPPVYMDGSPITTLQPPVYMEGSPIITSPITDSRSKEQTETTAGEHGSADSSSKTAKASDNTTLEDVIKKGQNWWKELQRQRNESIVNLGKDVDIYKLEETDSHNYSVSPVGGSSSIPEGLQPKRTQDQDVTASKDNSSQPHNRYGGYVLIYCCTIVLFYIIF